MGDPQTTPARFLDVLDRYELLDEDGMLRADVGLVSMGDHFDFGGEPSTVEQAGREILAWLASHAPTQVVILAGNHDLSRVMELAFETDASFRQARELAGKIERLKGTGDPEAMLRREFHGRFPRIPTPGIAARDYHSFSEAQRALVERLLLEGRMHLALTAKVDGALALLTHAAITTRELELLGLPDSASAAAVAEALESLLHRAVDAVRDAWTTGQRGALDLGPVHVAGTTAREGGGLLYHRPARRDRGDSADTTWEFDVERPRRFDPRTLPRHLVQVAGHSHHARCAKELKGWVDSNASSDDLAIRTLHRGDSEPRYRAGVEAIPGSLIVSPPRTT